MSEQTPKIDPRYRPEFQRGGSSAPPGLRPEPVPPVVTVGLPPAPPPTRTATPPFLAGAAEARPAASEADVEHAEIEPLARRRWFNPFITALWLVTVSLIFFGSAALQWAFGGLFSNASSDPSEMELRQLMYITAPELVGAGVLGVIGLLFWHAARWRERRS